MLAAISIFMKISFIRYDLVDLTRQSMQLAFDSLYTQLISSFKAGNFKDFTENSKLVINILDDIEKLLASDEHFLVGNWIEAAKSLANSSEASSAIIYFSQWRKTSCILPLSLTSPHLSLLFLGEKLQRVSSSQSDYPLGTKWRSKNK